MEIVIVGLLFEVCVPVDYTSASIFRHKFDIFMMMINGLAMANCFGEAAHTRLLRAYIYDTMLPWSSKGMTEFKSDIQNFGYFLFVLDLYAIIYV